MDAEPVAAEAREDFSLVQGGPLYQLLLRAGLVQPAMELLHRRILLSVLIAWLPLAVLTALEGSLVGGSGVLFLYDLNPHTRILLVLPLLLGAEVIVHHSLQGVVEQFRIRELIAPDDRPRFEAMISRAMRLRNSVALEVLLLVLAYTLGYWWWRTQLALHVTSWVSGPVDGSSDLTAAGWWYTLVSLPLFRFIFYRWFLRLFIWHLFLWQVSRLKLRLNPLHPDRSGGLGFVSASVFAFVPVLVAMGIRMASQIADRIFYEKAVLLDFRYEILGTVVCYMLLVLLPLTFFAFQMARARRLALREYGQVAFRYTNEFRDKWLSGPGARREELLGTADIQSLADLANSYDVAQQMGWLPFNRTVLFRLAILVSLPVLPLTLTMVPFDVLLERLVGHVL